MLKEYIFPIITGEPGQNNGYNSGGSSPTSDGYSPPSFNWTTWANWFSGISSGNNGNNNNDGNNSNNDDNNTNNPFSSGCPWGHISFYLFGKLHCFPIHGGGTGNNEDGELETFTTDNTGGRTTEEECLSIVKGMGIVTQESNLIQAYTSTNDPVSTQLNNCMNNSAIQAKINELESNNLFDPCSGKKISIDVKNLALDICFGCEKNGVGLTPESLEDAYYDALEENDYVDESEIADQGGIEPEKCPCVYAIWKQMKNKVLTSGVNENVCINDIFSDFLEGPLQVEIGISQNPLGDVNATTLPNTTLGGNLLLFNTRIEIDKDLPVARLSCKSSFEFV